MWGFGSEIGDFEDTAKWLIFREELGGLVSWINIVLEKDFFGTRGTFRRFSFVNRKYSWPRMVRAILSAVSIRYVDPGKNCGCECMFEVPV